MRDLAPEIYRQRLVVEGLSEQQIDARDIHDYLNALARVVGMVVLLKPVTHRSPLFGWAGWVHWETSGAHFYAWDQPRRFFSVDIYTCTPFDVAATVEFTRELFAASDIAHKSL